jgi:hypothetical protein
LTSRRARTPRPRSHTSGRRPTWSRGGTRSARSGWGTRPPRFPAGLGHTRALSRCEPALRKHRTTSLASPALRGQCELTLVIRLLMTDLDSMFGLSGRLVSGIGLSSSTSPFLCSSLPSYPRRIIDPTPSAAALQCPATCNCCTDEVSEMCTYSKRRDDTGGDIDRCQSTVARTPALERALQKYACMSVMHPIFASGITYTAGSLTKPRNSRRCKRCRNKALQGC